MAGKSLNGIDAKQVIDVVRETGNPAWLDETCEMIRLICYETATPNDGSIVSRNNGRLIDSDFDE